MCKTLKDYSRILEKTIIRLFTLGKILVALIRDENGRFEIILPRYEI